MKLTLTEREAKLLRFCKDNPVMASRFEEIMDLMAGCGDELGSVDEAEERIIELSRQLNAEMLGGWCQEKAREVSAMQASDPELRVAGKKNCGGTPPSGGS